MSDSLTQAAAALYHWMMANHIDPGTARITISLPDARERSKAEMAIKREFEPLLSLREAFTGDPLTAFKLHGVDFRLEARKDG